MQETNQEAAALAKLLGYLESIPSPYRDANLVFAYYASFAGVFTPDVLYQLWLNFREYEKAETLESMPIVVVSDLLNSDICEEVAFEMYEMNRQVVWHLKEHISSLLAEKKCKLLYNNKDLAKLLLEYSNHFLQHPNRSNLRDNYKWKSSFVLNPNKAIEEVKEMVAEFQGEQSELPYETKRIFLHIADIQLHNKINPEDYSKVPSFSFKYKDGNSLKIEDKELVSMIAKKIGLHKNPTSKSEIAESRIAEAKRTKATTLDLSGCDLTELPDELYELVWLEELNLGSQIALTNLGQIQFLTNLRLLNAFENQISDLSPLQGLTNLETLLFAYSGVNDLTPIRNLSNLKHLDVSGSKLSDLSPLQNLTNLQELNVSFTLVRDLSPLQNLTNLRVLGIGGTQVSELSPLSKLIELRELGLRQMGISDLNPLKYLYNLQKLYLQYTQVTDLTPLRDLLSLQELYLQNTHLSDLRPLEKLIKLEQLNLEESKVSDLTPLKTLTNLRWLNLSGSLIKNLSPLKDLIRKLNVEVNIIFAGSGIFILNCLIENPPLEVAQQGSDAILNFWASLENAKVHRLEPQSFNKIKNLLVGEGKADKTSSLKRSKDLSFNKDESQTNGILIEVQEFLNEFFVKKKIWSIVYRDDRLKNKLSLNALGITPAMREELIDSLKPTDFSEGPIERYGETDVWVFGKMVFGKEAYIKIALGAPGTSTFCISFHISEHAMSYPFK